MEESTIIHFGTLIFEQIIASFKGSDKTDNELEERVKYFTSQVLKNKSQMEKLTTTHFQVNNSVRDMMNTSKNVQDQILIESKVQDSKISDIQKKFDILKVFLENKIEKLEECIRKKMKEDDYTLQREVLSDKSKRSEKLVIQQVEVSGLRKRAPKKKSKK